MAERTHEQEWSERAKRYLKAELKRADVTYAGRAEKLNERCWTESQASVASKLSRGAFTATFFLAALAEIGVQSIRLADV